jgi:lysozyme family protein
MVPPLTPSDDAIFDSAIRRVLEHEGHFSDDPDDPGGATKYGISLRYAKEIGLDVDHDRDTDVEDIRKLPLEQAIAIYRTHWWDKYGYGKLGLMIGGRVFDLAVNMGAVPAHKCLQRALRAATGELLVEDGIIGPETLDAFHMASQEQIKAALRSEAAGHYRMLSVARPKFEKYLKGWLIRAYS